MKENKKLKKGFTLIELLVVVLIIGILAAIALPQYKQATIKTKLSELLIITRSLYDAQERYFLANNIYATNIRNLDLDFSNSYISPDGSYFRYNGYVCLLQNQRWSACEIEGKVAIVLWQNYGHPTFGSKAWCVGLSNAYTKGCSSFFATPKDVTASAKDWVGGEKVYQR